MKKIIFMLVVCLAVLLSTPLWAEPAGEISIQAEIEPVLSVAAVAGEVQAFRPVFIDADTAPLYNITMIFAVLSAGFLLYITKKKKIKPEALAYMMDY